MLTVESIKSGFGIILLSKIAKNDFGPKIDQKYVGRALFYKPIWQLTVNERGHYADSEDTFLFKIEDSPDTRLGA